MASDFFYGLLADHLVLGLMVLLMLLEIFRAAPALARIAFIATMLAAGAALLHQLAIGYVADIVPGEIRIDRFAQLAKLVILGCGLALALAFPARATYKSWLLLASALFGALIMMDSAGFASLFIGIEMLSLPAFALMVHGGGRGVAAEGAFKYLLLSSVASALLLFGVSLSYGSTGTLSLDAFGASLASGRAQDMAAIMLVMSGLFLKAAVFPFHAWAPDAYASARIHVTALLASVVKGAVVLALARVFAATSLAGPLMLIVAALAVVSIYFGNIAAFGQRRFRRMLAYSSIAHAGYMIFALLDVTGSRADDLLWYVAFYALATIVACASFAVLCPGDDDELQRLDGGFARHPIAALVLALSVLSLAGMPPLPGFFAKLFVFKSVIASGHLAAAILAFVGSFLGLAYYLAIVVRLFRTDVASQATLAAERTRVEATV
jgi:NADH-quinone oxidoreductase subunit N